MEKKLYDQTKILIMVVLEDHTLSLYTIYSDYNKTGYAWNGSKTQKPGYINVNIGSATSEVWVGVHSWGFIRTKRAVI